MPSSGCCCSREVTVIERFKVDQNKVAVVVRWPLVEVRPY